MGREMEMEIRGGNNVAAASGGDAKLHSDSHLTIQIPDTAHQISHHSWFQVGFVLTTGINSAYVLGYSGTIMVPLGWIGGVVGLILATLISLYAFMNLEERDISDTETLQDLFMAIYVLFRDDDAMKLLYFIALAGLCCCLFVIGIPHLSALRAWLAVSTFFSLVYIVVGFVLALKDGVEAPPRDYGIPGAKVDRIFTTIGAAANLVFAYNTGMLPEIQATVRPPVVENMMKGLYFQFTVGVLPMYAVTFMGYWAYGSNTSSYLLNNVNSPIWLKTFANISAVLQTIIALHIFASPMYEYLDTRFGMQGSALAPRNLAFRVFVRGGYLAVTTFISALLPFLGDFMSLTGAVSTFPLTFILANHMYLVAKRDELSSLQKSWHWLNVGFFSCMSVAAAVSAVRLIAVDSKNYHFFADL